jgi:F-type H+-transporting ATPase subunit epsilon
MTFPLLVFAVDREIFVGQVESVTVPSQDGELQILAEHTPLISQLKEGDLVITTEDGMVKKLPISGGVLEVKETEVVILANF